ncbi:MAG: hypothetical protein ACLP5V_07080, partial [Candidatus Bathyarchaeia archaeon]
VAFPPGRLNLSQISSQLQATSFEFITLHEMIKLPRGALRSGSVFVNHISAKRESRPSGNDDAFGLLAWWRMKKGVGKSSEGFERAMCSR